MIVALSILVALIVPSIILSADHIAAIFKRYPGFERLEDYHFLLHSLAEDGPQKTSSANYSIAIIGGSTSREAITSAKDISERLTKLSKRQTHVVDLTSSAQNLDTSAALAIHSLCSGADLAIIGINVARLARENSPDRTQVNFVKGYGLHIPPAALSALEIAQPSMEMAERRFVTASLMLLSKYLVRDVTGITLAGVSPRRIDIHYRHRYLHSQANEKAVSEVLHQNQALHVEEFTASENYFRALEVAATWSKACGGSLLLLDTPLHPRLLSDPEYQPYASAYRSYRRKIEAWAAEANIAFISMNDRNLLSAEDFIDFGHLRTRAGIEVSTKFIIEQIVSAKSVLAARVEDVR